MDLGLFRVAAAVPRVKVADVEYNAESICRLTGKAEEEGASLVVFPELSITGYTCLDLFGQNLLLTKSEEAVGKIKDFTRGKHITVVIGAPVRFRGRLYNCAIVLRNGGHQRHRAEDLPPDLRRVRRGTLVRLRIGFPWT